MKVLRDPFLASITVLVGLIVVGFVAFAVGWRGAADSAVVAVQLPYAISGVIGGLALVGFAAGLLSVQASRRREAAERAEFGRLVTAAADLLAAVRESGGKRSR